MSGDSFGLTACATVIGGCTIVAGAAVLLPFAAAGAAIYGVYKAAGALCSSGAKKYRENMAKKAAEEAANAALIESLRKKREQALKADNEYGRKAVRKLGDKSFGKGHTSQDIRKPFKDIVHEHEEHYGTLMKKKYGAVEAISKTPSETDTDKIFEQIAFTLNKWERQSEVLQTMYTQRIENTADVLQDTLCKTFSDADNAIKSYAAGSAEQKALIKATADDRMFSARDYVSQLAGLPEYLVYRSEVNQLIDSYINAEKRYDNGQYTAAVIAAESIIMNALNIAAEAEAAEMRIGQMENEITEYLAVLSEKLRSINDVSFKFEGKIRKDKIKRFAPDEFKTFGSQLDRLWITLENTSVTEKVYNDLLEELQELDKSLDAIYLIARNRMDSYYQTQKVAVEFTEALKKREGYKLDGYCYEQDLGGNPLHINYSKGKGAPGINIVISCKDNKREIRLHQYGKGEVDTALQNEMIKLVSEVCGTELICNNPDCHSNDTVDRDIEKQKQKRIRNDN